MRTLKATNRGLKKVVVVGISAMALTWCGAQTLPGAPTQTLPHSGPSRTTLGSDSDMQGSPFPDTSLQRRNDDRQRRIVSDTERLVVLTERLKTEIADSGAESLTPEMLRQMDEIEKLAKSVKEKMRN